MGIKKVSPSNSILIEGLWGLGKTQLSQAYCNKYGHIFVSEPFHTYVANPQSINDIDLWYLDNHKSREHFFEGTKPALVERSVLSSFAFNYALRRPSPSSFYMSSLKKYIEQNKVLVVYLKAGIGHYTNKETNLNEYSDDIKKILLDSILAQRYEDWYTNILPQEYGITPFVLRTIFGDNRRPIMELVNDIYLSLACDRIAQVNVVCFSKNLLKGKVNILVLKRNIEKGGFWQTITGGVRPGESLLDAANREIFEEIGLSHKESSPFLTSLSYSFKGNDGYLLDEYVLGHEINDPSEIQISEEHNKFEWLAPGEAKQRVKYDNNKKAIDFVYNKIEQPR